MTLHGPGPVSNPIESLAANAPSAAATATASNASAVTGSSASTSSRTPSKPTETSASVAATGSAASVRLGRFTVTAEPILKQEPSSLLTVASAPDLSHSTLAGSHTTNPKQKSVPPLLHISFSSPEVHVIQSTTVTPTHAEAVPAALPQTIPPAPVQDEALNTWEQLGKYIEKATKKNRQLEEENKRLREAIATRQREFQELQRNVQFQIPNFGRDSKPSIIITPSSSALSTPRGVLQGGYPVAARRATPTTPEGLLSPLPGGPTKPYSTPSFGDQECLHAEICETSPLSGAMVHQSASVNALNGESIAVNAREDSKQAISSSAKSSSPLKPTIEAAPQQKGALCPPLLAASSTLISTPTFAASSSPTSPSRRVPNLPPLSLSPSMSSLSPKRFDSPKEPELWVQLQKEEILQLQQRQQTKDPEKHDDPQNSPHIDQAPAHVLLDSGRARSKSELPPQQLGNLHKVASQPAINKRSKEMTKEALEDALRKAVTRLDPHQPQLERSESMPAGDSHVHKGHPDSPPQQEKVDSQARWKSFSNASPSCNSDATPPVSPTGAKLVNKAGLQGSSQQGRAALFDNLHS